jgi:hydrogenase nickel incorporation protein HypA/HybF
MHELSIALSLVDAATDELALLGAVRVQALRVRVGPLSGVVNDALRFAFEAAACGTPIDGARLDIDDVPVTVWCGACEAERPLERVTHRRCPVCGVVTPEIRQGAELELVGLEVIDV